MEARFRFTKERIEALQLPVAPARLTVHDERQRALQLRITSAGVRTFYAYGWVRGAGKPARVTLGAYPAVTIERARELAAKYAADFAEGKDPAAILREQRREMRFAELFSEYLTRHAKPCKRTWADDARRYRLYVQEALGPLQLSAITRGELARLHSSISRAQPITANRVLALVSCVLSRAVEWGYLEINPAYRIRKNPERPRDRFLQASELPRFWRALHQLEDGQARAFLLLALLTGARRSNLLAMRWPELDLQRAEWRIPMTKNGTPQLVPLPAQAVELLVARRPTPATGFVFPADTKCGHWIEPRKAWQRVTRLATIDGIVTLLAAAEGWDDAECARRLAAAPVRPAVRLARFAKLAKARGIDWTSVDMRDLRVHDLRRTLGSWQARTGASLLIIGKSLNHKSPQSTAIYARLDVDPVRQSVQRAVDSLYGAAGAAPSATVIPIRPERDDAPAHQAAG